MEEAIELFFEVASYTEVMEHLSPFEPVLPSEIQKQPKFRVTYTHQGPQQMMCEVSLDYA